MGKQAKFPELSPSAMKAAKEDEAAWAKIDANGADMAALREAEARGYARGELAGYERYASDILGPKQVQEMMDRYEAHGYARGVEDAARAAEHWPSCPVCAKHIRALLKPRGEAK